MPVAFGNHAPLWAKPTDIIGPGAPWLRIILRPHEDLSAWIDAAHAAGGKVLGVLARESFPPRRARYLQMGLYALNHPTLDAIEVGNEPDQKSPSSWTLRAADLNRLLATARKAWPTTKLICGGLVSGNPDYLKGVDLGPVDAIGLHPYGRGTASHPYSGGGFGTVADLVALYRSFGKPLAVTEFGAPIRDFDSEHDRAAYIGGVMSGLAAEDLEMACHFCWSDQGMVLGFGLLDENGRAKESYASFFAAAQALQGNWYDPIFAWAEAQYGLTPYVFGGRHVPPQTGWDCAGFVMAAFEQIGVDIDPAHDVDFTNADRLRTACDLVAEPAPGDLVFFQNTYPTAGASHVGIVKDVGAFVMVDDHDRSNGSGPGETKFGTPYWQTHLMGFGRVRRS